MIAGLDQSVLTVADIDTGADFYSGVLGMHRVTFGNGRTALAFGRQKINLHQRGSEPTPRAMHPLPGSADLCFLIDTPPARMTDHVRACGVAIIEGPVDRSGAIGPIRSLDVRDPDRNLIELAEPIRADTAADDDND